MPTRAADGNVGYKSRLLKNCDKICPFYLSVHRCRCDMDTVHFPVAKTKHSGAAASFKREKKRIISVGLYPILP